MALLIAVVTELTDRLFHHRMALLIVTVTVGQTALTLAGQCRRVG
jgi:hypothetical protein